MLLSQESLADSPLTVVIVGCEITFWVVLAIGLALRYVVRAERVSAAVLWCAPAVDLVLVIAVTVDLGRGAEAGPIHGLAAMYLGVSVAFGHRMVAWADARFAHRFAGAPAPVKPAGSARVAREWKDFGLLLVAAAIAALCILAMRYVIATPERTQALLGQLGTIGVVVAAWLVFGPVWTTLTVSRGSRSRQRGSRSR